MADQLAIAFATLEALPGWLEELAEPLVVMPFVDADEARRSALQLARRAGAGGRLLCVHDAKRVGFMAVLNAVFRCTAAPQVAYVAQDAFGGRGWLANGLARLAATQGGLLAFNDGKWGGLLAAFGLVDRSWAHGNYAGDLFNPSYHRHFADVELTLLAMQQGKLAFDPAAMVIEVDWTKESRAVSEADREVFARRTRGGFDSRVTDARLLGLFG